MRPDLQLFVHILSATALFGALLAVAALSWLAQRQSERALYAHASFWTLLVVALPSWALMFGFGSWTESKEGLPKGLRWVEIPSGIAGGGVVILLMATLIAYLWTRRPASVWQPITVSMLSTAYLAALAVAWWMMTAKVPS